eukprot:9019687-Lingulodinium_polyedra.AAC.1
MPIVAAAVMKRQKVFLDEHEEENPWRIVGAVFTTWLDTLTSGGEQEEAVEEDMPEDSGNRLEF